MWNGVNIKDTTLLGVCLPRDKDGQEHAGELPPVPGEGDRGRASRTHHFFQASTYQQCVGSGFAYFKWVGTGIYRDIYYAKYFGKGGGMVSRGKK